MKAVSRESDLHDGGLWRASTAFSVVILLGLGLAYSLTGTALGRAAFPWQAQGSLLSEGERVVGSSLLAQPFVDARYFQPRPSAAAYNPMAAAGSNQARTNPDLQARLLETATAVAAREAIGIEQVPADLITQSGGGLDPHISPAGAQVQVARVAKARGLQPVVVARLVAAHTEAPQFGVFGQARVNVLALNLALDAAR